MLKRRRRVGEDNEFLDEPEDKEEAGEEILSVIGGVAASRSPEETSEDTPVILTESPGEAWTQPKEAKVDEPGTDDEAQGEDVEWEQEPRVQRCWTTRCACTSGNRPRPPADLPR